MALPCWFRCNVVLNVNEAEASCLFGRSRVDAAGLGVSREAALSLDFGSDSQCFVRCGHTIRPAARIFNHIVSDALRFSSQTFSGASRVAPGPAVAPQLSPPASSSVTCAPGRRHQVTDLSIIHEDPCQFSYSHIVCVSWPVRCCPLMTV